MQFHNASVKEIQTGTEVLAINFMQFVPFAFSLPYLLWAWTLARRTEAKITTAIQSVNSGVFFLSVQALDISCCDFSY